METLLIIIITKITVTYCNFLRFFKNKNLVDHISTYILSLRI